MCGRRRPSLFSTFLIMFHSCFSNPGWKRMSNGGQSVDGHKESICYLKWQPQPASWMVWSYHGFTLQGWQWRCHVHNWPHKRGWTFSTGLSNPEPEYHLWGGIILWVICALTNPISTKPKPNNFLKVKASTFVFTPVIHRQTTASKATVWRRCCLLLLMYAFMHHVSKVKQSRPHFLTIQMSAYCLLSLQHIKCVNFALPTACQILLSNFSSERIWSFCLSLAIRNLVVTAGLE